MGSAEAPETAVWNLGANERLDLTATVGPDLSLTVNDGLAATERGENLTYSIAVENAGTVDANGVAIRGTVPAYTTFLNASDGGSVDAGTVSWPLASLAAGEALTRSFNVRVHPAAPPNVTTLTSTADVSDDGTHGFDPDRDNNTATDTTTLTAPPADLPDLAIGFDNLEIIPADPLAGDVIDIQLTVRNAGLSTARNVPVEIVSGDPTGGGISLFTHQFDEIPAAGNRRVTFSWPADEGLTRLAAVVDPDNEILELSESNNRRTLDVVAPPPTGPDLTIHVLDVTGLEQSPISLTLERFVDVEIRNTGDTDVTEPFVIRIYEDTDGDGELGANDPVLDSTTIPVGVPAGGVLVRSVFVEPATTAFSIRCCGSWPTPTTRSSRSGRTTTRFPFLATAWRRRPRRPSSRWKSGRCRASTWRRRRPSCSFRTTTATAQSTAATYRTWSSRPTSRRVGR